MYVLHEIPDIKNLRHNYYSIDQGLSLGRMTMATATP